MSRIPRWLKVGIVYVGVVFAASGLTASRVAPVESPKSGSCVAPTYRQFDFWAGDWDVFDVGSPIKVAHARVDLILDGCVLREDYQGTDGHKGQSFTIYDAARKVWHQSWVTNRGELLVIEGKIEAGEMALSGEDHAKGALVRGTWKPENGNVREIAVTSTDGGKTWKPWFDLVFRRTAIGVNNTDAFAADDRKIVTALDAQYQAAVKENDAATMERILADDFALVTGSGKIYSKADLLAEARSGHVHYERQDDTDQTVRVWGDTAVITARLSEKGTEDGKPFEYQVWFSDTYVRTPSGWRYVFGQASLPLPKAPQQTSNCATLPIINPMGSGSPVPASFQKCMDRVSNRTATSETCETGRMKVIAVIPARLASTRLPRKMLREIAGVPLLAWVYRGVRRCSSLDQVVVATDSDEIMRFCEQQGFVARMTSATHRSGTERVHEISTAIPADVYLNVQGDEPLTRPEHIESLIAVMQGAEVEVGTLKTAAAEVDIDNPSAVKVVTDAAGRALYFSRATIPHDRDGVRPPYYKHLGFYGYRKDALDRFVRWPESALERSERLEQLRFLENGVSIYVAETPFDTVGVDTEEDVRRVEEILEKNL